jgi:hypothetical protein
MGDPIEDFFDGLARRGYEPLLQHTVGSIRFDVLDGEQTDHWWVGVERGRVTVCHEDRAAGSVVRQDLRGEAGHSGESEPLVVFQRLFPDRPM